MYYAEKKTPVPSSYPYGLSGMGQVIPGIKPQTQQLVIYGSVILVGASVLLYFVLKGKKRSAASAPQGVTI